ncbi:MAG: 8-amino-7-oxononanoate synthase [Thermodesulfobacteriota bacterium]
MTINDRRFDFIRQELHQRRENHLLRRLRSVTPLSDTHVDVEGRPMLNFCSNDYLGLSKHPLLRERAAAFMETYGMGATASRLICGSFDCMARVENKLAGLKGAEAALILNSGFQANVSVLPALADKQSLILSDALNHNSLINGTRLCRCRIERFRHNDPEHLRDLLVENRDAGHSRILIITESIFSMDGDCSDIPALTALADEFGALLLVDEAHATGVCGPQGMGLTCGHGAALTIGTFGKACGSFGAYVAASKNMCDYLVNCCPGFIYSTALPPAVIGAIDAALDLIPGMEAERQRLHDNARLLRRELNALGFQTGNSSTQIIPVLTGGEQATLALSAWLEENGVLAVAIRPPTVPRGESRIRISLSAAHTREDVRQLVGLFGEWRKRHGA